MTQYPIGIDQLRSLSHHAYAIVGGDSARAELIETLEKQHGVKLHGDQDFYDHRYVNFTIDDAREVKSMHSMRPVVVDGRKIFILQMDNISMEAQNALLKLLEEPADYAHFFIIIPSAHLLLPTVKSRIQIIDIGRSDGHASGIAPAVSAEAQKFVNASVAKRLEMVKVLMDDITKEKKTKQDAIDLLNAVQSVVYENKGAKEGMKALESIEIARRYMNDRSPSLKMLLEYVALEM